jgi:ABC-2 type transport system permease protein
MSGPRALAAVVRKDVGVWLRQPAAVAVTVLPALGFMVVFLLASASVGSTPVALVQLGHGPRAQGLASVLDRSDAFRIRHATPEEGRRLLRGLDVAAVITIPANFDEAYDAHQSDPVTIEINNLNLDFTDDLRRALPAAITTFYAEQGGVGIDVGVAETDLRTQQVSLVQYELVPTLVLLLTIAGVVNCGLATAREFEDLTIKELLLSPISRWTLIAGKLIAGWLTTLVLAAIVLGVGVLLGAVPAVGWYWLPAAAVIATFALATASFGAAIGAAARRFTTVAAIGINVAVYFFYLSGGISANAFLPGWLQAISRFMPTYYAAHALHLSLYYSSTDQLGVDLAVLAVTAMVGLVAGVVALRRSTVT